MPLDSRQKTTVDKDQYCKDLSFENFSSDLVTVSKEELNNILKTYNYFKP